MRIAQAHAKARKHSAIVCGGLALALLFSVAVNLSLGAMKISPFDVYKALASFIAPGIAGNVAASIHSIVCDVRLPRVLMAGLVGMSLASSGCAMQALFRNPMATPSVVGVSAGASLGAALTVLLGLSSLFLPFASFLAALAAVFAVYFIARVGGSVPVAGLLLSGIAVSMFLAALLALVQYAAGEQQLREIVFWLMGGLWRSDWRNLLISSPPMLAGSLGLLFFGRELDALALGEETALDLGVDVGALRRIVLVAVALATAGATCTVGVIGFIGLIVPHLLRLLLGPGHRLLLPASMLGGAVFLIWADLLGRTIFAPLELPVGIITGTLGAPFFLWLLRQRRKALMGW